jgi:hypothetical protein
VTVIVNNSTTLSQAYAPRIDGSGIAHAFNVGLIGLGAENSIASMDNIVVQKLAPVVTYTNTMDFSSGTGIVGSPESGDWSLGDDRYEGTPSGGDPAIDLVDLDVGAQALIQLSATLSVAGEGGFVFDYYAEDDFKFINVSDGQITLGHRTSHGWFVDATYENAAIEAGTDHDIKLTIKGSTVSVEYAEQPVINWAFNAIATDGEFGLLSVDGTTSFDTFVVQSDDPNLPAGNPVSFEWKESEASASVWTAGPEFPQFGVPESDEDENPTDSMTEWLVEV